MIRTPWAVAALLAVLVPAFAACGADDPAAAPAAEHTAANGDTYNEADLEFATGMVPHHADALVMVDLTQGRDLSPGLARLTEDIRATQAPEIESMVDWLTAWGEDVPETSRDHVNSHGTGDGADAAMGMDPDDLAELEEADAGAFEALWLETMIEHHEGAIEMAEQEQEDGLHPEAVALAESVETGQLAAIELMQQMLDG